MIKRIATWTMYAVGVLAIAYLALFVYVSHTGRTLHPGKPIQIFRNPDAPSYSLAAPPSLRAKRSNPGAAA